MNDCSACKDAVTAAPIKLLADTRYTWRGDTESEGRLMVNHWACELETKTISEWTATSYVAACGLTFVRTLKALTTDAK